MSGSLPLWYHPNHRTDENILLLRPQTEDTRHNMFLGRDSPRILQMAIYRRPCRDLWIPESVRVRLVAVPPVIRAHRTLYVAGISSL